MFQWHISIVNTLLHWVDGTQNYVYIVIPQHLFVGPKNFIRIAVIWPTQTTPSVWIQQMDN